MTQPAAPSLEGGFFTTGPPGKSLYFKFLFKFLSTDCDFVGALPFDSVTVCFIVRVSQFSRSVVSNSLRPHEPQHARPPSSSPAAGVYPNPRSIESVMPSNHLILCRPLLLLPSIFPSIRVFSNKSALRIRWTKYWSFSFNISPSNEHSRLSNEHSRPVHPKGWTGWISLQSKFHLGNVN